MPIILKEFEWRQTDNALLICVPLKNAQKQKIDIVAAPNYIKLSQKPYIFELFLKYETNHSGTTIKVNDDTVHIELLKAETTTWDEINKSLTKEEMKAARMKSLDFLELKEQEKIEHRDKVKRKQEKIALNETMDIEQKNRSYSNEIKQSTRNDALVKWNIASADKVQLKSSENVDDEEIFGSDQYDTKPTPSSVTPENTQQNTNNIDGSVEKKVVRNKHSNMRSAPIRSAGVIRVHMTPREFPTALRESRVKEEQEWLRKQAEVFRKNGGITSEDMLLHEKDPLWLKDRGDSFYKQQNYLAAINAYNQAIKIAPGLYLAFCSRAECHLKLRNLHKAIEDSSRALELLVPAVESNAELRMRCHVSRAYALCHLQAYRDSLVEFEAARRLGPDNKLIIEEIEKVKGFIDDSSGSEDG